MSILPTFTSQINLYSFEQRTNVTLFGNENHVENSGWTTSGPNDNNNAQNKLPYQSPKGRTKLPRKKTKIKEVSYTNRTREVKL